MHINTIKHLLKANKNIIAKRFHVINIGLFGSYLREEQNENSDIDLLVTFKKGNKDFFNYMNLKFYLEELFKCEVDLVNKDGIKSALKKEILEQVEYV